MIKKIKEFFKPKQSVRLSKQLTFKEKVQNFINKHYTPLVIVGIIIALILFVAFIMAFVPGTESGLVYNNQTGVI